MILASGGHHSIKDRDNACVRRHARCYKLVKATECRSLNEDQHLLVARWTRSPISLYGLTLSLIPYRTRLVVCIRLSKICCISYLLAQRVIVASNYRRLSFAMRLEVRFAISVSYLKFLFEISRYIYFFRIKSKIQQALYFSTLSLCSERKISYLSLSSSTKLVQWKFLYLVWTKRLVSAKSRGWRCSWLRYHVSAITDSSVQMNQWSDLHFYSFTFVHRFNFTYQIFSMFSLTKRLAILYSWFIDEKFVSVRRMLRSSHRRLNWHHEMLKKL